MLNSKLVNSYYLYVKTNLKSMLLTLICIYIFYVTYMHEFQKENSKANNYKPNMFSFLFCYVCSRIKRNIKLLDYLSFV